ncbi:class I SAM-dependent methyltransferase [Hydrogenophaga sp. BPS33]|uniref:class I SAM-dependent methyltransferase n=1 Tax=Hydrogenophaga sp. BPS33 TaxID=2651974 RepID=UPI00132052A9|nr:class I SAM-dependent methyltransferase [Hydrogenophaga sp. BPS33]QHE83686.1 class I SAM-dependent methyltransferase [Hydrogenophaga sp. BPS33]
MTSWKMKLARTPVVGSLALMAFRARVALPYVGSPVRTAVKWLFASNETSNFTYELEDSNRRYLASLISDVTGTAFPIVWAYMQELEEDQDLKRHIAARTEQSAWSFLADKGVRFGRRAGWYAMVRILKPAVVIETGVDKGLGSCVLASALRRNAQEGHAGRYFGTDINPAAGYLFSGVYAEHGSILYGDSIESLKAFDQPIDLFINDSDHSIDYEADEYRTIEGKLSEGAVVLGDNAHCSPRLMEFAQASLRHFVFFQEKPAQHWYPGAGIGICFRRREVENSPLRR